MLEIELPLIIGQTEKVDGQFARVPYGNWLSGTAERAIESRRRWRPSRLLPSASIDNRAFGRGCGMEASFARATP
jgi:hypothetical protein